MEWRRYVPVAERRAKARREMNKLHKKGRDFQPIEIEGRTIARSFWGKRWCEHLESFSDYANRLPRGRTYVRNGSVCHLAIRTGRIDAIVSGSELYDVTIRIDKLKAVVWKSVKTRCSGQIGSMLELLQGKLSQQVMSVVTDRERGLFPKPMTRSPVSSASTSTPASTPGMPSRPPRKRRQSRGNRRAGTPPLLPNGRRRPSRRPGSAPSPRCRRGVPARQPRAPRAARKCLQPPRPENRLRRRPGISLLPRRPRDAPARRPRAPLVARHLLQPPSRGNVSPQRFGMLPPPRPPPHPATSDPPGSGWPGCAGGAASPSPDSPDSSAYR